MERRVERERLTLNGHLALLHRLEQRGLRLRRRAVDLVGQEKPAEDRSSPERELPASLVVDERPGEIRGKEVGGELSSREAQPEDVGERTSRQRLPEPR